MSTVIATFEDRAGALRFATTLQAWRPTLPKIRVLADVIVVCDPVSDYELAVARAFASGWCLESENR